MDENGREGWIREKETNSRLRYEAARYMEVSGSQVIVWGMALLPKDS